MERQLIQQDSSLSPLGSRLLLLDLDSSLEQPAAEDLQTLRQQLNAPAAQASRNGLGIITGRSLAAAARQRFAELHLPDPQVWITQAGTQIHYGQEQVADRFWEAQIGIDWSRVAVEQMLIWPITWSFRNLSIRGNSRSVISCVSPASSVLPLIRQRLRHHGQPARPHLRCHWFLDVLPLRASRSEAIRFLSLRWKLPLEQILVVASQQGDVELVQGLPAAVVPADHDPCLDGCRQQQRVYFANRSRLPGVLEGL